MDKAKSLYVDKVTTQSPRSVTLECDKISSSNTLSQGWALKIKKQRSNFTKDQKAYLVEKYNIGKRTGRKEDPFEVAEEMPSAMKGGVRRFSKSEFMSGQQVASFFSRLTQNDKKCDSDDDYNAAAEEQVLTDLKLEIMATIGSVKTPRKNRNHHN